MLVAGLEHTSALHMLADGPPGLCGETQEKEKECRLWAQWREGRVGGLCSGSWGGAAFTACSLFKEESKILQK